MSQTKDVIYIVCSYWILLLVLHKIIKWMRPALVQLSPSSPTDLRPPSLLLLFFLSLIFPSSFTL